MSSLLGFILALSLIIYTIIDPKGGDSPFKWVVYSMMLWLPIHLISVKKICIRYGKIMFRWMLGFLTLFSCHIFFANEQPLNDIILFMSFFSLSAIALTTRLQTSVWICLLIIFLLESIITLPSGFSYVGYSDGWNGFFQNSNTNSIFICSTLIATLLECKNKKLRYLIIVLALIGIIASRSRNALLVYLIIVICIVFEYKLQKYQRWFPYILVGLLFFAGYYMLVIEPSSREAGVEMFGKDQGSAGRSLQLIYLISNFDLSAWGHGRYINTIVENYTGYQVHNVFVASFYVLGLIISITYLAYIYWLYRNSHSYKFKICLLAIQFYLFFEPGYFFSVQLFCYLPMLVLCSNFYRQSKFNKDDSYIGQERISKLLANL